MAVKRANSAQTPGKTDSRGRHGCHRGNRGYIGPRRAVAFFNDEVSHEERGGTLPPSTTGVVMDFQQRLEKAIAAGSGPGPRDREELRGNSRGRSVPGTPPPRTELGQDRGLASGNSPTTRPGFQYQSLIGSDGWGSQRSAETTLRLQSSGRRNRPAKVCRLESAADIIKFGGWRRRRDRRDRSRLGAGHETGGTRRPITAGALSCRNRGVASSVCRPLSALATRLRCFGPARTSPAPKAKRRLHLRGHHRESRRRRSSSARFRRPALRSC